MVWNYCISKFCKNIKRKKQQSFRYLPIFPLGILDNIIFLQNLLLWHSWWLHWEHTVFCSPWYYLFQNLTIRGLFHTIWSLMPHGHTVPEQFTAQKKEKEGGLVSKISLSIKTEMRRKLSREGEEQKQSFPGLILFVCFLSISMSLCTMGSCCILDPNVWFLTPWCASGRFASPGVGQGLFTRTG